MEAGGFFFGEWKEGQPNAFMTWEQMEVHLGLTPEQKQGWDEWAAAGVPGAAPPGGASGAVSTLGGAVVSGVAVQPELITVLEEDRVFPPERRAMPVISDQAPVSGGILISIGLAMAVLIVAAATK